VLLFQKLQLHGQYSTTFLTLGKFRERFRNFTSEIFFRKIYITYAFLLTLL